MKRAILTLLLAFMAASAAIADGIMIIPEPRPWMPPNPAINVKYHHVDVEINDPIALTRIDQVFVNPFDREIEADYIFPIPEEAAISRFVCWLDGRQMEAELLDANQARRLYEDIVRRRKDPALLEYAGRGSYRLRVYPIPARGEIRFKIEYEQTLKSDNGTVEYLYPLNTEKFSGTNLQDCRVNVNIKSFDDIGMAYCPSHQTSADRRSGKEIVVSFSENNVKPDRDFLLYFTRQNRDFGFHLLNYIEKEGNGGFFLGLLSPPLNKASTKIDKNMIFVLDSSGSMRGDKFRQAIEALKFVLNGLSEGDDFNIIDYDDAVNPFREGLVDASKVNIERALDFANNIEAAGGTNIYDALAAAIDLVPYGQEPTYIIFLTDGIPTVGNTNIDQIIANTTKLNENRAWLFVFGVGYDVNAHLLDRLSEDNGGMSEYVLPNEDIEVKVSRLASKISRPALTDIALKFAGAKIEYVYPESIPDLFFGSEILIAGRYEGRGNDQAVVSGKLAGRDVAYEFPVNFSRNSAQNEFIPLLWANRRIAYLIQQMRLHGTSEELLAEVVRLSKKYGIVTEYTSFLVAGDEHRRAEEFRSMDVDMAAKKLQSDMDRLASAETGKSAVNQSQNLNRQQDYSLMTEPGAVMMEDKVEQFSNITQVGAQGFFQSGSNWIQGDLKGDHYDLEIKRFSDAYFQLLDRDPALGRYFGLGDQVRVQIGKLVVQISDAGQERLTDLELKQLFPN